MSRRSVQEIYGLSSVCLRKKFAAETADVVQLQNEVAGKLALNAKRVNVGVWSSEVWVHGVIELAFSIAEWKSIVHERGQRMSHRLRRVRNWQSPQCCKSGIRGQVTKVGIRGGVEEIRHLILNEVDGIGVDAVIDHLGAPANDSFFIAEEAA